MLREVEVKILLDIYERDYNNGEKLDLSNYDLVETRAEDKIQEFAYYILNLKRLKYIEFDEKKTFVCGGRLHQKYNNNVRIIFKDNLKLTEKGLAFVEEVRKTVFDKFKEEAKSVAGKAYEEVKDFTSKTIAEFFVRLLK